MAMSGRLRAVMQFDFGMATPKAFANFSPGLERSDNPGYNQNMRINAERVRHVQDEPLRGSFDLFGSFIPGVVADAPTLGCN